MAVVFVVAVAIGRPAGPMAFKAWRSPSTTSSTAAVSPRSLRFSLHFLHFGLSFFFPRCFSFSFLYFHTFLLGRPPPRFFCLFTEFSFSFVASSFVFLPPLPPCGRVPSFLFRSLLRRSSSSPPPPSLRPCTEFYRVSFYRVSFSCPPPPEPSVSTFGTEFHRLAKGFVDLPGLPGFYSFLFVFPILFFWIVVVVDVVADLKDSPPSLTFSSSQTKKNSARTHRHKKKATEKLEKHKRKPG